MDITAPEWRSVWLHPLAVRLTARQTGGDYLPDPVWLKDVLMPALPVGFQPAYELKQAEGQVQADLLRGGQVSISSQTTTSGEVSLIFSGAENERFYGFGEWFNGFARRQGRLKLRNLETPAVLQGRQTYSNIPYFISSRGYAAFLLNSRPANITITPGGGLRANFPDGDADLILISGQDFKQLVDVYTQLTGRSPLLPRWAFGLWVTSYPQEKQERVEEIAEQHRQRSIPLDAIILDYHWEEKFHNFRWRPSLFNDPAAMIASLKERGIRTGLIFTPFVNKRNDWLKKIALQALVGNVTPGEFRADERPLDLYAEGLNNGYFAHPNATWWFGGGGMIDFTNPAASRWWNDLLKPLYDQGVAFFKNDDGEYLPGDAKTHNGMDGSEAHNPYGFYYSRAIYEGMQALDDRRAMIYARSVWAGSQRYPAIFLGDQKPTYTDMQRTICAGLNMSLAGFSYWTADTFGLDGKTNPETHMRGLQIGILSPVMRYFLRPPSVDSTRFPWAHGEQAEANFKRHLELRYRLLPYFQTLAWQAYLTGCPIARPLFLEYPDDAGMLDCEDQLMLGPALMAAPVLAAGARKRMVRFPAGDWYHYWSGKHYQGPGIFEVPAPLDQLPLFVRGGHLLPLGPAMQFIPDGHHFDALELHVWPPFDARLDFPEDDGASRAYQQGEVAWSGYALRQVENGIRFSARASCGGYHAPYTHRRISLVLHNSPGALRVASASCQADVAFNPVVKTCMIRFIHPLEEDFELTLAAMEE